MAKWTISDIPDLNGKIFLITGANSGLGYESAKALLSKGGKVIMAIRNLQKGEEAVREIRKMDLNNDPDIRKLDLSDLNSIEEFASAIKKDYRKIDVLLNNAGIMATPYGKTEQGFEQQFGVNHLGHFALTGKLLGLFKNNPGSRVVNVSSIASRRGKIDFDDLMGEKKYKPMKAYRQSKLANLLFTFRLQRYFVDYQVKAIALAAHPGISATNLVAAMQLNKTAFRVYETLFKGLLPNAARGALSQLYASTDPQAKSAGYYGPGGWFEASGYPAEANIPPRATDREAAERLWRISEQLTGVEYDLRI